MFSTFELAQRTGLNTVELREQASVLFGAVPDTFFRECAITHEPTIDTHCILTRQQTKELLQYYQHPHADLI